MDKENKKKRYEKIEFLGEGQVIIAKRLNYFYKLFSSFQFATVYKARDLLNDQIVAVKKVWLIGIYFNFF